MALTRGKPTTITGNTSSTPSIYDEYSKIAEQARLENLKRSEQVTSIFDEIIKRYGPAGSFGAGYEKQFGRQKVQDVSRAEQRDISSGLYGLRDRGGEWEATTGAESRLRLEDLKMERLSSAQQSKASFLERIDTPYPDYSSLMQLAQMGGEVGEGGAGSTSNRKIRPTLTFDSDSTGGGDWLGNLLGRPQTQQPGSGIAVASGRQTTPEQKAENERKRAAAEEVNAMMAEQQPLKYTPGGGTGGSPVTGAELSQSVQNIDAAAIGKAPTDANAEYEAWLKDYLSRPGAYITSGTKKRWMSQQGYA